MSRGGWNEALLANSAFFAALPEAAREEFSEGGRLVADEVLQLQKSLVPVFSGKERKGVVPGRLRDALTIAEAASMLRFRVGYPQLKGKKSKIFYAIYMEYGRKGGVVSVRRLKQGARGEWRRRVTARSASSRVKPEDLLSTNRTMRVGPLAPRPFVRIEKQVDGVIDAFVKRFWDEALVRAEAKA